MLWRVCAATVLTAAPAAPGMRTRDASTGKRPEAAGCHTQAEADLDEAIEKYLKIKEGGQHGQAENLRGAWG